MATTVQNIIDGVKWQADLQQGGRLANADLIPEIDAAYKEAWEAIVAEYDDYFIKKVTDFAIVGGVGANTYQITATDFYKLKAIQPQRGATFAPPLPTHTLNEAGAVAELSYRLAGDLVYFEPELSCAGTYRLWYVYTPPDLTLTSDTIVDLNGAVKMFIRDAVATRAVLREEDSDVATMEKLRDRMMGRIARMAAHRNAGRGKKVQDTRRGGRFRFMTRSGMSLPS